jgi:hypothetical protein
MQSFEFIIIFEVAKYEKLVFEYSKVKNKQIKQHDNSVRSQNLKPAVQSIHQY